MKKTVKLTSQQVDEAIYELQTLRDMLRWGFSKLRQVDAYYGHGTDNAWDEAVYLTLHALHLGPILESHFLDSNLTTEERTDVAELIAHRINERIPAAYLTKEAWFAGLPFYVDERVLIPRSPIAELIEQQFAPWVNANKVHHILDMCTGSGCIAIACAVALPDATIDATDISKDALEVAKTNVQQHGVSEQVKLIKSDLFTALKNKKYDIIVSNPPYVDAKDMKNLPAEYRHEPVLGLAAGKDGLDFAVRILKAASQYLNPEGILIVEVGNSEEALRERYPQIPFTWLEFQRGDGGVFLLTAEQLKRIKIK